MKDSRTDSFWISSAGHEVSHRHRLWRSTVGPWCLRCWLCFNCSWLQRRQSLCEWSQSLRLGPASVSPLVDATARGAFQWDAASQPTEEEARPTDSSVGHRRGGCYLFTPASELEARGGQGRVSCSPPPPDSHSHVPLWASHADMYYGQNQDNNNSCISI